MSLLGLLVIGPGITHILAPEKVWRFTVRRRHGRHRIAGPFLVLGLIA